MKPRSGQARPKLDPKPGRKNDAFSATGRSPDAAREVAGGTAVETQGGGGGAGGEGLGEGLGEGHTKHHWVLGAC